MAKFVTTFALTVCLLALATYSLPRQKLSWDEYKERYNKLYTSPKEDISRQAIFEDRMQKIELFNLQMSELSGYKKGINHLTDLTREEYMKLNGLRVPKHSPIKSSEGKKILDKVLFYANQPTYELPKTVDWTAKPGRVGPVEDQGSCGSCWAFATVGIFEGQEYKNSTAGSVIALSEQNLVDCDLLDKGCEGGYMSSAVDFIIKEGGLMTEHDYPYKSSTGITFNCSYDERKSFVTTWGYKRSYVLPEGDEKTLEKVVATYGPVAVGIDASSDNFQDYTSGVYFDDSCVNTTTLDHAVLVVGYGTDEKQGDYWLIKNSWSEEWGEKGYFKLARNHNNHCGVADIATIVV